VQLVQDYYVVVQLVLPEYAQVELAIAPVARVGTQYFLYALELMNNNNRA
jgi:hypothetical protein